VDRVALKRVSRAEVENAVMLASLHEDAKGFACKIALLEDEIITERLTREVSERGHREQFEELSLLQTQGSELCHTIVGLPRVRHHLPKGAWLAALRHTKMAGELAVLGVAVSSTVESMLWCSPSKTFRVEVVGELAVEFQKMEDQRSQLERPAVRICDLLLGPPIGQA
jgi:hypothetical protein